MSQKDSSIQFLLCINTLHDAATMMHLSTASIFSRRQWVEGAKGEQRIPENPRDSEKEPVVPSIT